MVVAINVDASELGKLDQWIETSVSDGEEVLCRRVIDDEVFFVSRHGDRFKAGALLDVSTDTGQAPAAFVVGWHFEDDAGTSLDVSEPPADVKRGYTEVLGRHYAERVTERHLALEGVKKVLVSITLKKYKNAADVPNRLSDLPTSEALEPMPICSFALPE